MAGLVFHDKQRNRSAAGPMAPRHPDPVAGSPRPLARVEIDEMGEDRGVKENGARSVPQNNVRCAFELAATRRGAGVRGADRRPIQGLWGRRSALEPNFSE